MSQKWCSHVNTNTVDNPPPRNSSPRRHVPSNRARQPLTPLAFLLWHLHSNCCRQQGTRPGPYQALNLGRPLPRWTATPPPPPRPDPAHPQPPAFANTSVSLPAPGPTHAWQAETPNASCYKSSQTSGWQHKAWQRRSRGEKIGPISHKHLPILSLLSEQTPMFPYFHGGSVYQGSPALLSSLIRFLTLNLSLFFFFSIFPSIRLNMTSLVSLLPHHLLYHHLISLIICLCLCWSANDSLLANSWDWSFLHGLLGFRKWPVSPLYFFLPFFSSSSCSSSSFVFLPPIHDDTALHRGGALCGALTPAGKTLKPYHLTCTGLNSQEEGAGGYRRAGGREESGAMSEPNTNKDQHPGKKKSTRKKKSEGKMTLCATKWLFNLIQRGDTSAIQLPDALPPPPPTPPLPPCAPYMSRSRTCAMNYENVCTTVPTSTQKIQSWRILQLRYSSCPGDLRRLLLSPLAFHVRVRLWSTSESRRSEVALGWLKGRKQANAASERSCATFTTGCRPKMLIFFSPNGPPPSPGGDGVLGWERGFRGGGTAQASLYVTTFKNLHVCLFLFLHFKSQCDPMCVRMHQILMGAWSLAKPHYHNFFFSEGGEEKKRVSLSLQIRVSQAGDKNSLKAPGTETK